MDAFVSIVYRCSLSFDSEANMFNRINHLNYVGLFLLVGVYTRKSQLTN